MTTIKEKIKEKLVKVVWTYAKKTIKDANEESTSHGLSVKKENDGTSMNIICLRMSSGPPPLDDKRAQNDHNFSPHVIGPTASG